MKPIRKIGEKADSCTRYISGVIEKTSIIIITFAGIASGSPSLSKCQSPPPVTAQMRRAVTPDNPDPAEVITEVNQEKNCQIKIRSEGFKPPKPRTSVGKIV